MNLNIWEFVEMNAVYTESDCKQVSVCKQVCVCVCERGLYECSGIWK